MVFLQNIWWYLVLIGVMILVHELGHFWAARWFDVKIETFSFGFGPRLFGFRRGETDFRFSAILFGGYVKMLGEHANGEAPTDPRSLLAKPRWQRMTIAFAGPAINLVLAVVVLTGLFMVRFPKMPMPRSPFVGAVAQDGAAAKAGILAGDQILEIAGIKNPTWDHIQQEEISNAKRAIDVVVKRNGEVKRLELTPVLEERQGIGYAGWAQETDVEVAALVPGMDAERAGIKKGDILISANGIPLRSAARLHELIRVTQGQPVTLVYSRSGQLITSVVTPAKQPSSGAEADSKADNQTDRWMIGVQLEPRLEMTRLALGPALAESVKQNVQSAKMIYRFLQGIAERRMSAKSLEGPIRIAQLSGDAAREGAVTYFGLMAAVSLNLAIFNLLPVPILDGGVMLMLFIEMIMRRDLDLRVKEAVLKVGFVFLMAVVMFVLYNDISKVMPAG